MNREGIKRFLPHREPMLLVDELAIDQDGLAHGVYHVKGDEFFLQGHFPGKPVVPGVILCEIMAQTCSIILGEKLVNKIPYFTGIDNVKFKNKVLPGDKLEITAHIEKNKGPFYFTQGELRVNNVLCASGKFSFALVDA